MRPRTDIPTRTYLSYDHELRAHLFGNGIDTRSGYVKGEDARLAVAGVLNAMLDLRVQRDVVRVLVGVRYMVPGGGSKLLSMVRDYDFEPQVGDWIELAPEKRDGQGVAIWSAMSLPVEQRWIHRTEEYALEVHIQMPRGELARETEDRLRAEGYS